jgi:hypothetical protein
MVCVRNPCSTGRLGGDARCGSIHDHHRFFCLTGHTGCSKRIGCEDKTRKDVDFVPCQQFGGEALGDIRLRARVVLVNHFDLFTGDGIALRAQVSLDTGLHLGPAFGGRSGQRGNDPDADGLPVRVDESAGKHQTHGKNSCSLTVHGCLLFPIFSTGPGIRRFHLEPY